MKKLQTLPIQIFVLVTTGFILGCSEFVIVGILNDIAQNLHTSVASVGYLVTIFALVYAVSTPIIATMIGQYNLYYSMAALMIVFIGGNVLSAVAVNFSWLALSRVITALVSGVIVSLAMTFANYISSVDKRPRVIAGIYSGFSIASVLGVPIGTWISIHWRWQAAFMIIAVVSVLTLGLMLLALPNNIVPPHSKMKQQLQIFTDRRILIGMLLPLFNLASIYPLYTYLRPILSGPLKFSANAITIILFLYGITSIISNQVSGWLAERDGLTYMPKIYGALLVVLLLLPVLLKWRWLSLGIILLIGIAMYLVSSPIAIFYLDIASQDYPQSILLASSINSIFSNFGIAVGSATGSFLVGHVGLLSVGPSGALYAVIAIIIVILINNFNKATR
ncbi:MFS transporter [Bombilactobacillus bombi]|uniref:MFS transporter n=1 Tax=Bombilactobacillus bombi TaxID=1303590 RepID=UPI0015E5D320|nr:MFS transporter [Bombilactobacillus bombi]MBA1433995.1 MFS transporter [Bombilactobacillus bombi]